MAWQSTLEQARSVRLGRHTVIGLAAGIAVGLTLGLLIGWVWWPVEWQGAGTASAPAAATGSQFEAPEAKALYLGAVADAFVYGTAAGDADAGSAAAQRLAALGGDMRTALNNAIDFYGAQAGSAARVNNLTTLAAALGIPLADPGETSGQPAAAPAGQAAPGVVENSAQNTAQNTAGGAAAPNGGSGNWLLALLTALVLIAGGVYILWTLKRRQEQGEAGDGFVAEAAAPVAADTVAFERSSLSSPVRSTLTPAASVRSTVDRPQAVQAGGPHGFDAEELDEYSEREDDYDAPYGASYSADDEPEDEFDARVRQRTAAAAGDEEDAGDDEWEDESDPAPQIERQAPPPGFVTSVGATPPFLGSRGPAEVPPPAGGEETAATQPAAPRMPPATLQPPTPSRFARYTPVESYTATYYIGRTDFDHTQNIENPSDGKYIGEYGIGISASQGLLHDDLNKAISIDVYLFDKSDDRQLVNVKRSLLSLYADDHKRSEFERDRQALPPIVAQPNTNFQLEGVQLLLDCLIKQVDYTPEGYFKNVLIELVLKRKN